MVYPHGLHPSISRAINIPKYQLLKSLRITLLSNSLEVQIDALTSIVIAQSTLSKYVEIEIMRNSTEHKDIPKYRMIHQTTASEERNEDPLNISFR